MTAIWRLLSQKWAFLKVRFLPISATLVNSCWPHVDPWSNLTLESWKGSSEVYFPQILWSETSYWLWGLRKTDPPHAGCWNNHLHFPKIFDLYVKKIKISGYPKKTSSPKGVRKLILCLVPKSTRNNFGGGGMRFFRYFFRLHIFQK